MSEITYTRKDLRRAVALDLQMPFFRRVSAGQLAVDSGCTTTKIIDSVLRQKDEFWNGQWFFAINSGEVSLIRSFNSAERSFQLETALAAAPAAGDPYEIHALWNAIEIHAAINRAILAGGRVFPETVVDTSLIMQEDVLTYTISTLAKRPWVLNKIWIENPSSVSRGTASAGGASTITVEAIPSGITSSWKVSIYDGTGKGQVRNYSSHAGLQITVDAAWTTNPGPTSRYAIWDASEETYDWSPLYSVYQDAREYPDQLRLRGRIPSNYGMRFRIEYLSAPTELTDETSTTVVPKEYILPMAASILHSQKINNTRADRDMHFAESERYKKEAEMYMIRFAPHTPDTQIPSAESFAYVNPDDPLGWSDR